jgi:hypothetical protein
MRCYLGRAETVDRSKGAPNARLGETYPAHPLRALRALPLASNSKRLRLIMLCDAVFEALKLLTGVWGVPNTRLRETFPASLGVQNATPGKQF